MVPPQAGGWALRQVRCGPHLASAVLTERGVSLAGPAAALGPSQTCRKQVPQFNLLGILQAGEDAV